VEETSETGDVIRGGAVAGFVDSLKVDEAIERLDGVNVC